MQISLFVYEEFFSDGVSDGALFFVLLSHVAMVIGGLDFSPPEWAGDLAEKN